MSRMESGLSLYTEDFGSSAFGQISSFALICGCGSGNFMAHSVLSKKFILIGIVPSLPIVKRKKLHIRTNPNAVLTGKG